MIRATFASALVAGAACLACQPKGRAEAQQRLSAASPRDRAAGVSALARIAAPSDDEAWGLLVAAAHDGSALVRTAAAGALLAVPREDTLDAVGGLLRDPEDAVRLAAAQALGAHCSERGGAYLRLAFSRSDAKVRAALAEALGRCGTSLAQVLAKQEAGQRLAAHKLLEAPGGAQRARGALQLGRLGRDEDVAALLPLLDDRDGAVVAAAAEALGEAGAQAAAPRLAKLLDEQGEVAGAAAEGLRALGQVGPSRAALAQVAARDSDESEAAALALGPDCEAALHALRPRAAALLARDCPAAPLVRRLEALVRASAKPEGATRRGRASAEAASDARPQTASGARTKSASGARTEDASTEDASTEDASTEDASTEVAVREPAGLSAALEALLVARGPAPEAAPALSALLAAREPDPRACRAAELLQVSGAGPALVALVRRERAALEEERSRAVVHREDDDAAAEVNAQAARAATPAREKYDKLMAKIAQHQGTVETKASAQDQLAALLRGGADAAEGRRALLIAALHAARALHAPGAEAAALALAADPDLRIAAAARGEETAPPALSPAPDAVALRAALFSDDGRDRAAACEALAAQHDQASEPTRRALGSDPERRVRLACAGANETARPKKG
jgi:HEAT repeat protein